MFSIKNPVKIKSYLSDLLMFIGVFELLNSTLEAAIPPKSFLSMVEFSNIESLFSIKKSQMSFILVLSWEFKINSS